jgi:hypothetical protein
MSQVLSDRLTVNDFVTLGIPLAGYARATRGERVRALKGITFLHTRYKDKGKGIATTIPPAHLKGKEKYLWKWRLPVGETDQLMLIRNVCLDRDGGLCKATRKLAAALKFAHHVGAASRSHEAASRSHERHRSFLLCLSCFHIRPCVCSL